MPRWAWRLVVFASILFAAGISGSWLGQQMTAPLPSWWGWLGAGIAGIAQFGGVSLGVQGQRIGWAIVGVAGAAAIVFDYHYFGSQHGILVSGVLGTFPTVLAVLGGIVEANVEAISQSRVDLEYERQREREYEIEEREVQRRATEAQRQEREADAQREHALRLAKIQAAKEAKLAEIQSEMGVEGANVSANLAPVLARPNNRARVFEMLDSDADISNTALSEQLNIDASSIRAYRSMWRKARMLTNGHHAEDHNA